MKSRAFKDEYGRRCGLNRDNWSLFVPEGTRDGRLLTRLWVAGGPPEGILVDMHPDKLEQVLLGAARE